MTCKWMIMFLAEETKSEIVVVRDVDAIAEAKELVIGEGPVGVVGVASELSE